MPDATTIGVTIVVLIAYAVSTIALFRSLR
jgi:hypothetical protein